MKRFFNLLLFLLLCSCAAFGCDDCEPSPPGIVDVKDSLGETSEIDETGDDDGSNPQKDTDVDIDALVVPPEPFRLGAVSDDTAEEPVIKWIKRVFCPDVEPALDHSTGGDLAYTVLETPEGPREAIVASVEVLVSHGAVETVALAVLDPETGEPIKCITSAGTPFPGLSPTSTLPVSGRNSAIFTSVLRAQDSTRTHGHLYAMSLDPESETRSDVRQVEIDDVPFYRYSQSVRGSGQLLFRIQSLGLVAFDLRTKSLRWVIGVDELPNAFPNSSLSSVYTPTPNRAFVFNLARGPRWQVYEIDEDGSVIDRRNIPLGALDEEGGLEAPMLMEDHVVMTQFRGHTVVMSDWDGETIYTEEHCIKPVSVSPSRIACLKNEYSVEGRGALVLFDLDGGDRRVISLPVQPESEFQAVLAARNSWIVAGGDNKLVTVTQYSRLSESSTAQRTRTAEITIVDLNAEPAVLTTFEIEEEPRGTNSNTGVPVLTPSGLLVVQAFGQIHAVQTAIPGLAAAPYPRGSRLGGNENRGYVHVP